MTTSVLILAGGPDHAHDFAANGAALVELCVTAGHRAELVVHPDEAADRLTAGDHDALVVNALWWRMFGEKYDPWRDRYAYHTLPSTRDAIAGFVSSGGGLVGSHTASICFDDWAGWRDVLGGAWDWNRSSHPPAGPVDAVLQRHHPVVDGLPPSFRLVDEVFGDQNLAPGTEVLACARRQPDDEPQPVVWTYECGDGRVVYDGFGHDAASLTDPHHARLLRQAIDWVMEER
jgi:uncharacterized protein